MAAPGILTLSCPSHRGDATTQSEIDTLASNLGREMMKGIPLIVLVDDAEFTSATFNNFLWVTFTRSNPSHDIYGVDASIDHKHWGCKGPLIIDARIKSHHAPVLEEDPGVLKRIEKYFRKGGVLQDY